MSREYGGCLFLLLACCSNSCCGCLWNHTEEWGEGHCYLQLKAIACVTAMSVSLCSTLLSRSQWRKLKLWRWFVGVLLCICDATLFCNISQPCVFFYISPWVARTDSCVSDGGGCLLQRVECDIPIRKRSLSVRRWLRVSSQSVISLTILKGVGVIHWSCLLRTLLEVGWSSCSTARRRDVYSDLSKLKYFIFVVQLFIVDAVASSLLPTA